MSTSERKLPIKLLGRNIYPGESVQLSLDIARLPTRTPVDMPILVERAKEPGPVLLLTAGIHGNEINGMEILRRMIRRKLIKPVIGTVICIPVVNIFGLINKRRELPDGKDLNRSFPGSLSGSMASKMANMLVNEIFSVSDYVIDFHTGGDQRQNIPQLRCAPDDTETLKMARVFHPPFIIGSDYKEKSFRRYAYHVGKPLLLFEGGESMRIDESVVKEGVNGTLRVMNYLKMRPENPKADFETTWLENSTWIRARSTGMFQPKVKLGSQVKKGQQLGIITDPFGEHEKQVRASHDGFIICVNNLAIISQGEALFHLAF